MFVPGLEGIDLSLLDCIPCSGPSWLRSPAQSSLAQPLPQALHCPPWKIYLFDRTSAWASHLCPISLKLGALSDVLQQPWYLLR